MFYIGCGEESGKEGQRGDSGSMGICAQLLVSPDAGDVGMGRGCGRMVDVGSVDVGGTGTTQLKGLRTSKTPGVPASAVSAAFPEFPTFVVQWAVVVVVLPSRNTDSEESRRVNRIPGKAVGL